MGKRKMTDIYQPLIDLYLDQLEKAWRAGQYDRAEYCQKQLAGMERLRSLKQEYDQYISDVKPYKFSEKQPAFPTQKQGKLFE